MDEVLARDAFFFIRNAVRNDTMRIKLSDGIFTAKQIDAAIEGASLLDAFLGVPFEDAVHALLEAKR